MNSFTPPAIVGEFRKSERSGAGNDCGELAPTADGGIAIRNSKRPGAGTVYLTSSEAAAMFGGIKDGEFDDLLSV